MESLEYLYNEVKTISKIIVLGMLIVLCFTYVQFDTSLSNTNQSAKIQNHLMNTYLVVDDKMNLVGWGNNENGLIKTNHIPYYLFCNKQTLLKEVVALYTNEKTCAMAVTETGELWGWGKHDQLTLKNLADGRPNKIMENVSNAAVGTMHALAVQRNGSLWGWGWNYYGTLGIGESINTRIEEPTKIMENIDAVYIHRFLNVVLTQSHDLYIWGSDGKTEGCFAIDAPMLLMKDVQAVCSTSSNQIVAQSVDNEVILIELSFNDNAFSYAISETTFSALNQNTARIVYENLIMVWQLFVVETVILFTTLIILKYLTKTKTGVPTS